jgi:hypothetical protein
MFCNAYGTSAITQKRDVGALLTKIAYGIGDPKQQGTITSSNNVLSIDDRLGYTRLFARWLRNQPGTQKLTSTWCRFPIQMTISKIGIQKTIKCKRKGRQVPKPKLRSISQIAEKSSWGLVDAKSSTTLENEHTYTNWTVCLASSSSGGGSRSCSGTLGSRALFPRQHPVL